jgi:glycosyltransferase involved in cell wall biosynthesis
VPERDVVMLAGRMQELLANHALRKSMGRQARVLCESRFDIQKQTQRLEAFYDKVLA